MNDLCQIEREIFFVFAVTLRTTIKFFTFTLPTHRLVPLDKANLKLMQTAHLRNFD